MSTGLEEYYPGSREKREVNHVTGSPADEPPGLGTGALLLVKGREIEFFGITDLARILGRQSGTIRAWEQRGIIPASGWTKPGRDHGDRGKRRLWTRAQVTGIWRIARDEGLLDPRPRTSIQATSFTPRVTDLFRHLREEGIT